MTGRLDGGRGAGPGFIKADSEYWCTGWDAMMLFILLL